MAVLQKGSLFPTELSKELINKITGKSSLARLSGATPLSFNGNTIFTFGVDDEVDLVEESGAKSPATGTITPVQMAPVKVEFGMRVSDEFLYASEEAQIDILRAFNEGFAKKAARGLDIMAFHGVNPRTGNTASSISAKSFDTLVTKTVTATSNADADVTNAIAKVEDDEYDVTGAAFAPAFRTALASLKKGSTSNEALYPELAWGNAPSTINGLPVDVNSTVSFNSSDDRAIIGNFQDYFRYGFAKEIPVSVIKYGDPDNTGYDLAGHNQVYIRAELYLGWGILLPAAFCRIEAGE